MVLSMPCRLLVLPCLLMTAWAAHASPLLLKRAAFDPLRDAPTLHTRDVSAPGPRQLLMQFNGPLRAAWLDELQRNGATILGHIPTHALLVAADPAHLVDLDCAAQLRWVGPYHPGYRLPEALEQQARGSARGRVAPQIEVLVQVGHGLGTVDETLAAIEALGGGRAVRTRRPAFTNLRLTLPLDQVETVAALPNVIWIEPVPDYELFGERANQVQAGQLSDEGIRAVGPGYADWLARMGVDGEGVVVQVQDTGVDAPDHAVCHPDLCDAIVGNFLATRDDTAGDLGGHGTINAGIIAGRGATDVVDEEGYHPGLGVAPRALVYNTKLFDSSSAFDISFFSLTDLAMDAVRHDAVLSNNSWGCGGCDNVYDGLAQEIDFLSRDADIETPGNQPLCFVFSAGNSGPGSDSVRPPGTAKNDITVGALEGVDNDGNDGCRLPPQLADDARALAPFSSRGPSSDFRLEPTLVSVGTHVRGPRSTHPNFDGSSVCDPAWPPEQALYARSSGTSHSAPMITGAAALFVDLHRQRSGQTPSPALIKAALVDAARAQRGDDGAGGALGPAPDQRQGWGRPNLQHLLDRRAPRIQLDQTHRFTDSGQVFALPIAVVDPTRPLGITLTWTDAPGMLPAARALVNDLDLEVMHDGLLYHGNQFVDGVSIPGGGPDYLNNVERVLLPQVDGIVLVRVRATALGGDGVPGNDAPLDQDFALVIDNAHPLTGDPLLALDRALYRCDDAVGVTLIDPALGEQPHVEVIARHAPSGAEESVVLTRTHPGVYRGEAHTRQGEALLVRHGAVQAHALLDCQPATLHDVGVLRVGDDEAVLTWRADKPVGARVRLITLDGEDERWLASPTLAVTHHLVIDGLAPLRAYRFEIWAWDEAGNETHDSNGDQGHAFHTLGSMIAFSHRVADGTAGWNSAPLWMVAEEADTAFWSYRPSRITSGELITPEMTWLISPPIDLTRLRGAELRFMQRHNMDYQRTTGMVDVSTDGGANWSRVLHHTRGTLHRWHEVRIDLSAHDGATDLLVRFHVGPLMSGSWDVRDVSVRAALRPGTDSALWLDAATYACDGQAVVHLLDPALQDANSIVTPVNIAGVEIGVRLDALPGVPGAFAGAVSLGDNPPTVHDALLAVRHGALSATATLDCRPPVLGSFVMEELTARDALLTWHGDEPSRGRAWWGVACDDLMPSVATLVAATQQRLRVPLPQDRSLALTLELTDLVGNATWTQCLRLRTPVRHVLHDDSLPGALEQWTAQAPWERTQERAFEGEASWTDSAYRVAFPGVNASLVSPLFDFSDIQNARLAFHQTYHLGEGRYSATVEASTNAGLTWSDPLYRIELADRGDWHEVVVDLSALDHQPSVQVRFRFAFVPGMSARTADGWYVDAIRLYADIPRAPGIALEFDRAKYGCASTVGLWLHDVDGMGIGAPSVTLRNLDLGVAWPLTLQETPPGGGTWYGSLRLNVDIPALHGDRLQARHTAGGVTVSAVVDCAPPQITIDTLEVLDRGVRVTVSGGPAAEAWLVHGLDCGEPLQETPPFHLDGRHELILGRLAPATTFALRAFARDEAGNLGQSACRVFVTPPAVPVLLHEIGFQPPGVELYHPGGPPVALDGWRLRWTGGERGGTFRFPADAVLQPLTRMVLNNTNARNTDTRLYRAGLGWNAFEGGSAALLDADDTGLDFVRWNGAHQQPPPGRQWLAPEIPNGLPLRFHLGRAEGAPDTQSGADWYPIAPSLGEPNDISTPTPSPTPFDTPTIAPNDTVIETFLISGNPLASNERLVVGVRLRNNDGAALGSYHLELLFDPAMVELRDVQDAGLGGLLLFSRHVRGGANVLGSNISSSLFNGDILRLEFETRAVVDRDYEIRVGQFLGSTLIRVDFTTIETRYDWRETRFLYGTPTATPTGPTATPTWTPTPSHTATFSPTPDALGPRLETVLLSGNPCERDARISVGIRLLGNTSGRIGSYAVGLPMDFGRLYFVQVRDGGDGMGVAPATAQTTVPSGTQEVRAFVGTNFLSTLRNGMLLIADFDVIADDASPHEIGLVPYGNNPLITTAFAVVPARMDGDGTRFCLPALADFDGDGLPDALEDVNHLPPARTNRLIADSDGDGLLDGVEDANRNGQHDPNETNPRAWDSDGDGWGDGVEFLLLNSDPLDPNDPGPLVDADGDGLPASIDPDDNNPDTDGDRYRDAYEAVQLDLAAVTDPSRFPPLGDVNDDGLLTNLDALMLLAVFLQVTSPESIGPAIGRGDMDLDGVLTNRDSLLLTVFPMRSDLMLPLPR